MDTELSLEKLNQETQNIWDQNAQFWDSHTGEGNAFQRQLIGPSTRLWSVPAVGEYGPFLHTVEFCASSRTTNAKRTLP